MGINHGSQDNVIRGDRDGVPDLAEEEQIPYGLFGCLKKEGE